MALLDRCESCGDVVERNQLVRMRRKYKQPAGHNLFTYSNYNSSGWTASTSATAYQSAGCHPDSRRITYNDSNTATVKNPVSVWKSGYDTDIGTWIYSAGVVHAANFYYRFSVVIGQYERGTVDDAITVRLGAKSGSDFSSLASYTLRGGSKLFWLAPTTQGTAGTIYWAINVLRDTTQDIYWWFEHAQLETSTTTPFSGPPLHYIETTGTAKTYTTDTVLQTVAKVCPSCRERIVEDYELRGIPRTEPDEAIPFGGSE